MNPGSSETSGLNLPPPVGESLPPLAGDAENRPAAPEKGPAAPETYRAGGQAAPPVMPLPLPDDGSAPATLTATQSAQPAALTPVNTADDGDLIEKEWVNKAKAIVERTRNDPHKQSQELTVVKADYMKQRYDKTLKVKP